MMDVRRDDTLLDSQAITVCVASIGRPSLVELLKSLERMRQPVANIRVIIADDSPDGAARRLVTAYGPCSLPVEVYSVQGRNIASARNVCIDRASSLFIAFVDDDEQVDPDWLCHLHSTAQRYKADAVFGAVNAVYPEGIPSWLKKVGLFCKYPGKTGERVNTGATANVLMRLDTVRALGFHFNEDFGRTGGEDTEFFFRLSTAGCTLVASAEALVSEEVPRERLEIAHLRKRYTRGGHTYAHVVLMHANALQRMTFYSVSVIKMAVSGAMALAAWPFRRDLWLAYATRFWGHAGKLLYAADRPRPQLY